MPRAVAVAALIGGLAVAGLGVALPRPDEAPRAPRVTLEPERPDDARRARAPIGTISGRVVDVRSRPLAGQQVVLRRFRGTQPAATLATSTDRDGRFRFGGLPIAPTIAHTIKAVFEEGSVSELFHGDNQP